MSNKEWAPRGNGLILKAILDEDIYQKKLQIEAARKEVAKNKDGNPIEELGLAGFKEDEIIDQNGDFYYDDYSCFVERIGDEVSTDIEVGDEVYLSPANMKPIKGLSDRSKKETYFFAVDGVIILRRPGKTII